MVAKTVKTTAAPGGAAKKAAAAKKTASVRKATPAKRAASAKKTAPAASKATTAKTAAAKKATAKRPPAKRPSATKATAAKTTTAKTTAKKTGAHKVVAKKTVARTAAPEATAVPTPRAAVPEELPVRPGEDPWTAAEVADAREELQVEGARLKSEIAASQAAVAGLLRDSGDGAGDDQADTGTKNITREHEMALAANAREMLAQTEHALERLDAGTYGACESCGNPIGKARMQAFPRATLCMECKQKQERR
jgi:RNA polymerase-binding protein DksA